MYWAICFVGAPLSLSLCSLGAPVSDRERMEKPFSFSRSSFLPRHWLGPSPPPLPLALTRKENPAYTPGIPDQTKTLEPVSRVCAHSPPSQGGHTHVSPGCTCDCVWESTPPHPNLYRHPMLPSPVVQLCPWPPCHPHPLSMQQDCEKTVASENKSEPGVT